MPGFRHGFHHSSRGTSTVGLDDDEEPSLITKLGIDLLRAAADRAKREAQAAQSKASKARMRYDLAEMGAQAAQGKAEEAHKLLVHLLEGQGVPTDVLGNEGDSESVKTTEG